MGSDPSGGQQVHSFIGDTSNGQALHIEFPSTPGRFVQIRTLQSPSWVAWKEIEIYAASPFLGAIRDTESDGQPSSAADGDDLNGAIDDEDGVTFTSPWVAGEDAALSVTTSAAGLLNAWVDLNNDGDWADSGEQVFIDTPLVAGNNSLSVTIPLSGVVTGQTFARFRFNSTGGLSYDGTAIGGEVEDYTVTIYGAPNLAAIGDQNVDEQSLLTFTAVATDSDQPPQILTYSLVGAPSGAAIDPITGVFTWTPTEAQGPGSYTFDVVVSDGGYLGTNSPGFWPLGELAGGTARSEAFAISADGQVVVGRSESTNGLEAFRWTEASGIIGLGDLTGDVFHSEAYAVSADGSNITGFGYSDLGREVVRWTSTGMAGWGFSPPIATTP